jgi:hypothetical protein
MPIEILDKQFNDPFGEPLTFYRANAGDKILARIKVRSTILVQSSSQVYLTLDPINNIITWTGGDFEVEGFRIGDSLFFSKHTSGGGIMQTWTAVVQNVIGNTIDVSTIPTWIDATNGEIIRFAVTNRNREGLILDVNHVLNGQMGSEFSLIDGEVTRFTFDLTGLTGANSVSGIPVGNQSGQMVISAMVQDQTIATNGSNTIANKVYNIVVEFINTGMFNPSWFSFSGCLKYYLRMRWQSFLGEPFDNLIAVFNDDADTGYFDEPFNTEVVDATLVQGIDEIAFDTATTATFIIDCPTGGDWGIGGTYRPQDETYFKNRPFPQQNLSMTIGTQPTPTTFPDTYTSEPNDSGALYDLGVLGVVQTGSQYAIEIKFSPNNAFSTFMSGRDDGDRLFQIWARFGNLNLLVYNDQLTSSPPIGGPLNLVAKDYLDHKHNTNTSTNVVTGYEANIEDDLAFVGMFRIPFDSPCQSLVCKIEAYNTDSGDSFTLQSNTFDIASVPMVGGKHILNLSQPVFSQFPTTSAKRVCELMLESTIDTLTEYGVRIYMPFLYRWQTWISQPNANADFFPFDQTKNWLPYGTTGDWVLRMAIDFVRDGLLYDFTDEIIIKNYDSNPTIDQTIQLFTGFGQPVNVVTEGLPMFIVATHRLNDGTIWDLPNTWGMITIEPTESSPRWISSTIVPFDNNPLNPLTPITGLTCSLTLNSPDEIELRCAFDPTKIDLSNGVKITSKIKQCCDETPPPPPEGNKMKIDGMFKLKADGTPKMKS